MVFCCLGGRRSTRKERLPLLKNRPAPADPQTEEAWRRDESAIEDILIVTGDAPPQNQPINNHNKNRAKPSSRTHNQVNNNTNSRTHNQVIKLSNNNTNIQDVPLTKSKKKVTSPQSPSKSPQDHHPTSNIDTPQTQKSSRKSTKPTTPTKTRPTKPTTPTKSTSTKPTTPTKTTTPTKPISTKPSSTSTLSVPLDTRTRHRRQHSDPPLLSASPKNYLTHQLAKEHGLEQRQKRHRDQIDREAPSPLTTKQFHKNSQHPTQSHLIDQYFNSHLTPHRQSSLLHDIYRLYDANGDDSITRREFKHLYKQFHRELNLLPSRHEFTRLVKHIDPHVSNDISFKEMRLAFDESVLPHIFKQVEKRKQVRQSMEMYLSSNNSDTNQANMLLSVFQFYSDEYDQLMTREGFKLLCMEFHSVLHVEFDQSDNQFVHSCIESLFSSSQKYISFSTFSRTFTKRILPRLYQKITQSSTSKSDGIPQNDSKSKNISSPPSHSRRRKPLPAPPMLRRQSSTRFHSYLTQSSEQKSSLRKLFDRFVDQDHNSKMSHQEFCSFINYILTSFDLDTADQDELDIYWNELLRIQHNFNPNASHPEIDYYVFETWWLDWVRKVSSDMKQPDVFKTNPQAVTNV